jgi:hypothetical protein
MTIVRVKGFKIYLDCRKKLRCYHRATGTPIDLKKTPIGSAEFIAECAKITTGARARHPSLLTGMVFDETGERLSPTYAVKKETRYRYYVSTPFSPEREGPVQAAGGYRPAIWKAW